MLTGGLAFDLQYAEGDEILGPYTRIRIRQMLYDGSLTGRERVRLLGSEGAWSMLAQREEFAEVLSLLDIQVPRTGRIQGWQSQSERPVAEAPELDAVPDAPRRVEETSTARPILLIFGGVALLIGVLYMLMLQW